MKLSKNSEVNMKRKLATHVKNHGKTSVLTKTYPFLRIVSKLPKKSRDLVLKQTNGDEDIFKSFREIAINSKLGNLKLNKNIMKKYSPIIDQFAKTRTSSCSCGKRKKMIQKGSGLIAAAIPILASIAYEIFKK